MVLSILFKIISAIRESIYNQIELIISGDKENDQINSSHKSALDSESEEEVSETLTESKRVYQRIFQSYPSEIFHT